MNPPLGAATDLIANASGVNMTGQLLYGDNGYLIRRPMHTFLTEANISQFFTNLGF